MDGIKISNLLGAGLVLAGASLLVPGAALADVKAGVDAWTRGDHAGAVREWQGPAARGDADALFNLAQAYKLGRGVPQDLVKAEELFGRAAAQGHPQASDNYGLLLFQRGERARALPHIRSAADRGDPRAQYLLGVAHFNGDAVPKDWVRAYALASLAQQAGLAQAAPALAEMDRHIPLGQRRQAAALAAELSARADATRARKLAAADLGTPPAAPRPAASAATPSRPQAAPPSSAAPTAQSAARVADSARTAGADFARPAPPAPRLAVAPVGSAPPPPATATGGWRIQLGAFGVAGNAEKLWQQVKGRTELAGHGKLFVSSGRVTKLQAVGFAGQADAQAACRRLAAAGFSCLTLRD